MRTASGLTWDGLRRLSSAIEHAKDYTSEQRRQAAKDGAALPDGSYPIYSQSDLNDVVREIGAGDASADRVEEHIKKRAKALGLKLPDSMMSS